MYFNDTLEKAVVFPGKEILVESFAFSEPRVKFNPLSSNRAQIVSVFFIVLYLCLYLWSMIISHVHSLPEFHIWISFIYLHYTFNVSTSLLELTVDLPTMSGFIAQWLEHLPRHGRGHGFESPIFATAYVTIITATIIFVFKSKNLISHWLPCSFTPPPTDWSRGSNGDPLPDGGASLPEDPPIADHSVHTNTAEEEEGVPSRPVPRLDPWRGTQNSIGQHRESAIQVGVGTRHSIF